MTLKQMLLFYKSLQDLDKESLNFYHKCQNGEIVNCFIVIKEQLKTTIIEQLTKEALTMPLIVNEYIVGWSYGSSDFCFNPKVELWN